MGSIPELSNRASERHKATAALEYKCDIEKFSKSGAVDIVLYKNSSAHPNKLTPYAFTLLSGH